MSRRRVAIPWVLMALQLGAAVAARAQQMPPAPVRYAEARRHSVRSEVVLPGTVVARTSSVVASEVAGLIVELLAREGDAVRRGQPIAILRRRNLELQLVESKAQLQESQARLELARRSLGRSRELFESGVISQQQLDDAVSESEAWQGQVGQNEAAIARLEDDLARSRIAAPFDGVVVAKHVDVGEWLNVGGAVVELLSLEDLEVVTALPERYFDALRLGAPARVSFEALPAVEVEGEVSAIIPRADPQARTFPVKIRIDNPGGRIGVGMLARLSFAAGAETPAVVVPKDAVVTRPGGGRLVYVIDGDDTVREVVVTTGAGTGEWVAIEGGIGPGDRVVVRGNERLRAGQTVEARREEYELP